MLNLWFIAAGALAVAAVTAIARRSRADSETSLAPPPTAVPPVSDEWLSNARGKGELHP